jgi:hypothetical protein
MKRLKISFLYFVFIFGTIVSLNVLFKQYFIKCKKLSYGKCDCENNSCKFVKY